MITTPIAIIVALLVSGLVFSLESLVFAGAINFSKLGISTGNWSALFAYSSPYATLSKVLVLPAIVIIAIIVALIATFKDGVIYYGGTARVGEVLAREDKFLPKLFDRMNVQAVYRRNPME